MDPIICSLVVSERDSSTTVELTGRQCTPVSPSRPNVDVTTADVSVSLLYYSSILIIFSIFYNMISIYRTIMKEED